MSTHTHTAPTWHLNARGRRLKARALTVLVGLGWLIAGALAVWMSWAVWISMVLASSETTGALDLLESYAVSLSAVLLLGLWLVLQHELIQIARHARAAAGRLEAFVQDQTQD